MTEQQVLIESFKQNHQVPYSRPETIYESLKILSSMESINESASIEEESTIKLYKNFALNKIEESILKENTFVWPYYVSPFFTPEEVTEFKGYYAEDAYLYSNKSINHHLEELESQLRQTTDPELIARIKQQLDSLGEYSGEANDFYEEAATGTQFNPKSWNKKIIDLTTRLKYTEDPEEVDQIKQDIVNLGWNPEIDYTVENQIKAKKRIESIYQERFNNVLTLDITSLIEASDVTDEIINESSSDEIRPIHVVFVKGKSAFSNAISAITKGDFSHAAICLDNNFNKLYSFNLLNGTKNGGFSIEDIKKYPKKGRLAIHTFFVKKEDYDKISKRIKILADNAKDTTYGIANILLLPFKNINVNFSNSMICSQFVDSILKMAHVDITNKDSSHVDPNYLYKMSKSNNRVYKIFDGVVSDFKANKAINYINRMAKKAKSFSENMTLIEDFTCPIVLEARLPIQFNKDGDALLTNTFVNFDAEYSSSHKLLMQYAKAKNAEGMKYELARLYYMNYILERRLYHNKYLFNKEKNIKTRARVLNDFKKYMDLLLKIEPDFNFGEYYEKSVFYPHTVEVKSGTLLALKDIIKHIL
jgi:hypothetical protein